MDKEFSKGRVKLPIKALAHAVVVRSGEGLDPQIFRPHRPPRDGGESASSSAPSGDSVATGSSGSRPCARVAVDIMFLIELQDAAQRAVLADYFEASKCEPQHAITPSRTTCLH